MGNGYTVTPAIFIDQYGNEQVSYDHGQVYDHATRLEAIDEVTHEQSSYISSDADGNLEHEWDVGDDGEQFQREVDAIFDGEDVEDVADNDQEIIDHFHNLVGGEDIYKGMLMWAQDNLDEESIEAFNEAFDDEDYDLATEYVTNLIELYSEYV